MEYLLLRSENECQPLRAVTVSMVLGCPSFSFLQVPPTARLLHGLEHSDTLNINSWPGHSCLRLKLKIMSNTQLRKTLDGVPHWTKEIQRSAGIKIPLGQTVSQPHDLQLHNWAIPWEVWKGHSSRPYLALLYFISSFIHLFLKRFYFWWMHLEICSWSLVGLVVPGEKKFHLVKINIPQESAFMAPLELVSFNRKQTPHFQSFSNRTKRFKTHHSWHADLIHQQL